MLASSVLITRRLCEKKHHLNVKWTFCISYVIKQLIPYWRIKKLNVRMSIQLGIF